MACIGFIGTGNMGRAMIGSLKSKGYREIISFDRDIGKLDGLCIRAAKSNSDVVSKSEMVFICVKPSDIEAVLKEIKPEIGNRILVSIAAGVKISRMESIIGKKKIVRVMPNTPCLVGEMAAGYSANKQVSEKELNDVAKILSSMGEAHRMPEKLLDAVTGLSGSGPAFIAYLIECFASAGRENGLDEKVAYRLALKSFLGTAKLLEEKGIMGFLEREVTPFGNSAKVDCPKKFIGKRAYLIICKK